MAKSALDLSKLPKRMQPHARNLLEGKDISSMIGSAYALGGRKSRRTTPVLGKVLLDPKVNSGLKRHVAAALGLKPTPDAIEPLAQAYAVEKTRG